MSGIARGGWAQALNVDPNTPLDQALITRILDFAEAAIRKPRDQGGTDPTPGVWNPLFEQAVRDWRASTENALRKLIGQAIGTIPNNLAELAPQGNPLGQGTLLGDATAGIAAGIGDAVSHGAVLGGIVVLIILGLRQLVAPGGSLGVKLPSIAGGRT